MASAAANAVSSFASKTKTKKKHFVAQKVKLFRASDPLLSVLMWGINHSVSQMSLFPYNLVHFTMECDLARLAQDSSSLYSCNSNCHICCVHAIHDHQSWFSLLWTCSFGSIKAFAVAYSLAPKTKQHVSTNNWLLRLLSPHKSWLFVQVMMGVVQNLSSNKPQLVGICVLLCTVCMQRGCKNICISSEFLGE